MENFKNRPRRSREKVTTAAQDCFLAQKTEEEIPRCLIPSFRGNTSKQPVIVSQSKTSGIDFGLEVYLAEDS